MILGESAVGKSSIILRFILNRYDADLMPSIGGKMQSREVKITGTDEALKLCVWDTAGQEKYRSVTPMYFHDANAVIIVYDISDSTSVESARSWHKEVLEHHKHIDDLIIVLLGNKSDLIE